MRDYQKTKVYRWETKIVAPHDEQKLSIEEIQDLVAFMWAQLGLNHPPKVSEARKNKRCATGYRLELCFPERLRYRWVAIHELAHAVIEDGSGTGDGHGPKFVTTYVDLLEKFMCLPKPMLWFTLNEAKIDFEAR